MATRTVTQRKADEKRAVSLAYIQMRAQDAEQRDLNRNRKWDRIERLRFRQHEVPIPTRLRKMGVKEVRTPLVDDILRVVVNNIAKGFPTFSVPPPSVGAKWQVNTSKREKWLNAVFTQLDSEGMHRPYRDEIDQAAMFGFAAPKLLYLPDAWDAAEFERQSAETDAEYNGRTEAYAQQAPIPFAWLTPDPRTVHIWSEYNRITEVLEVSQRPRYQLAERYRDQGVSYDHSSGRLVNTKLGPPVAETALGQPGQAGEKCDYIEHWDLLDKRTGRGGFVTYVADGIVLSRIPHKYDRLPYFPYFGLSASSRAPEYEAQSVVDDMLDLVEGLDYLLTLRLSWAVFAGMPMGIYRQRAGSKGPLDDAGNPLLMVEYEPGAFKTLFMDDELSWLQAPQGGADMKELGQVFLELADRAGGVPDILRGQAKSNTPAWGMAQLLASARRIYDPITDNASISQTARAKFVLWLIEHRHGQAVYVLTDAASRNLTTRKWLGLGPDDIKGYYAVEASIETLSEDRRIQMMQAGLEQVQAGAISMIRHRQDNVGITAPEEEELQIQLEQFQKTDKYKELVWGPVLRALTTEAAQVAGAPPGQVAAALGGPLAPLGASSGPNGAGVQAGPGPVGVGPGLGSMGVPGPGAPVAGPGGGPLPGPQPIRGMPSPQAPVPGLGLPTVLPPGGLPAV